MWFPWKRKQQRQANPPCDEREKTERNIFDFRDGDGEVCRVDPIAAWVRFVEDPELDPTIHIDQLECDEPKLQAEASRIIAGCSRRVLCLPAFDGANPATLTDQEAIDRLWEFLNWVEAQKKTTDTRRTSRQPTA